MYSKNNLIAIYVLIGFFIFFNVIYSKLLNLLIFIAGFIISKQFVKTPNALLIGAVSGMIVGIVKNFHLLENFEQNDKGIENELKIINMALLNEYMKQNKDIVVGREVKLSDLKPTKSKISSKIVKKLKENPSNRKAITITDDNYIIDGHHQWYVYADDNFKNSEEKYIRCNIIKKNLRSFINDIKELKHLVNKNTMEGLELDKNKIQDANMRIQRIKQDIHVLEQHVNNFSKLAFV